MSLEQFTYSYIFKISQSVYYTMNQLYMICTSTKSFIFLFLSQKSLYKTATFVKTKQKVSEDDGQLKQPPIILKGKNIHYNRD